MTNARGLKFVALACLALAAPAFAEDAPIDLHANPAPAAKDAGPAPAAKSAKPAKPAPPPPASAGEAIARANAYFESARVLTADFVQIGPDGRRTEGELFVQRPGKMLFKYAPPTRLQIVADGRTVAVRDDKLHTQDLYLIAQTPLKFLLSDHIDIARDTKVLRVGIEDTAATVEIEDKATLGGSAHIALVFDPASFALKQWTVIDAQGFQTVVTLFNVDLASKPDPALFHIDETIPSHSISEGAHK